MKLFLAGGFLEKGSEWMIWDLKRLYSYHYLMRRSLTMEEYKIVLMKRKKYNNKVRFKDRIVDLFLDSGAFSADSQGATISLKDYAAFIKKYKKYISVYANLDVIGDAEASYKNQLRMERMGLSPMPVFHANEDFKYLHLYIKKYNYIGLGGTARAGQIARDNFMDKCFNIICDSKDRMPKVKVHGFGLTSIRHMTRYPWYSVDSTSWILTGRMGYIFVPRSRNGKWVYDEASRKYGVSNKSPSAKVAGQHIDNLSEGARKMVMSYVEEKGFILGKSEFKMKLQTYELKENECWFEKKPKSSTDKRKVEIIIEPGLRNMNKQRDQLNIMFFLDLEESRPKWPWSFELETKPVSLFD